MKCEEIRELVPEYVADQASAATKAEIRSHLATCAWCREETESLSGIWAKLGWLPDEQPGPEVQSRFYAMLEGYRQGLGSQARPRPRWRDTFASWTINWLPGQLAYQFAFAFMFLVVGLVVGYLFNGNTRSGGELTYLREEVHSMRQLVTLSLLQQQSASERLRGVSWSHQVEEPTTELISALLEALDHDPSSDVRLAAVDALKQFSDRAPVRQGLIKSLARQSSPLVQIALIDLMVELRERQSAAVLRQMIQDAKLNEIVKKRAEWGLAQLI